MDRAFVWLLMGLLLCGEARAGTLSQEAYIWQRVWGEPVLEAVGEHGRVFDGLSVLVAEVSWKGGAPSVARIDYAQLRKWGGRFGLVMRVQSFKKTGAMLRELARELVMEAREKGLEPYELQVDFDCAQSGLAEYGRWLGEVREGLAPLPVTFTALPTWLREAEFERLARANPGYVLQVHSLASPITLKHPTTLCDTNAARAAVERASRLGVPFRVALPTYAYVLAFDKGGGFVGLSAEGPRRSWPAGTRVRELWADPEGIAALVGGWKAAPPAHLRGFTWYRFPVRGDVFNWRWPTLAATMEGRSPQPVFATELRLVEAGLYEAGLANRGEVDLTGPLTVTARWSNARLVASDGLQGWQVRESGVSWAKFAAPAGFRLPAGDRRVIGWLRLSGESEIQLEIQQD